MLHSSTMYKKFFLLTRAILTRGAYTVADSVAFVDESWVWNFSLGASVASLCVWFFCGCLCSNNIKIDVTSTIGCLCLVWECTPPRLLHVTSHVWIRTWAVAVNVWTHVYVIYIMYVSGQCNCWLHWWELTHANVWLSIIILSNDYCLDKVHCPNKSLWSVVESDNITTTVAGGGRAHFFPEAVYNHWTGLIILTISYQHLSSPMIVYHPFQKCTIINQGLHER